MFGNENDNDNADSNNVIFTMKDTKLYVPAVTLSAEDNQKPTKLFSKGFERPVYCNEYKKKVETKLWQITIDIFFNIFHKNFVGANRLFVLIYQNLANSEKKV